MASETEGWVIAGFTAIITAIITWFGNIMYMRDKFVSREEQKTCQEASKKKFDDGDTRMTRIESDIKVNLALTSEIHGALKANGTIR